VNPLWLLAGAVGIAALALLAWWQMIVAEGTYLGPRVVAWTYDLVASRYDDIKQFNPRDESWFVARPLLVALSAVERPLVLDVATGTGRLPLALLGEHLAAWGGRIAALDLSPGMLRRARAKLRLHGEAVRLIRQDAGRLPFEDGTFDAVTCLESLEFMPRPAAVLGEMVRVLAPGGALMVTNRVGAEARLLPGRALPRPAFEALLATLPLGQVDVRPWQSNYDLATARKEGAARPPGNGGHDPLSLLLCPACGRHLARAGADLACAGCARRYGLDDGIADLAQAREPRERQ
jgi:ubiquinone/menaquinone biosynthesis C-methylase UbiE